MMSEEKEIQTTTDKTLEERVGKLEASLVGVDKQLKYLHEWVGKLDTALFSDEQKTWNYREIQRMLNRTDLHPDMENRELENLPERVGDLEKKVAALQSETVSQSWRAPTSSEKEPTPKRALRLALELAQILRTLDKAWLKQGIVESLAAAAGMEVVDRA
jgi:hypothetical protein